MNAPLVGIIGAGQLGRMMALAAYPLGIDCRFLDTHADSPGGQIGSIRVAGLDDQAMLEALAAEVDVVTFDIENVSVEALKGLQDLAPVHPAPDVVAVAQDRLSEKALFESLSIPTAPYVRIGDAADIDEIGDSLGWPVVLKARRLGYDGRGQRIAADLRELQAAWDTLGRVPAIAEGLVNFERELSMIAVRGAADAMAFYPLTENEHRDGILVTSLAPYTDETLQQAAQGWLGRIMQQFDYRGILVVEFFATAEGLLANEMAPRVHNSGHWTIEGAETSQFENHVRAILGLPLGSTRVRGHAAMLNLIGRLPSRERVLAIDGAHFHDYGKMPRPARKLGHCTMIDDDRETLLGRFASLRDALAE
jgi:5-(carboxyamino)imidazole ribonucleotide synthase